MKGVDQKDDLPDSERRRTRSQTRGGGQPPLSPAKKEKSKSATKVVVSN